VKAITVRPIFTYFTAHPFEEFKLYDCRNKPVITEGMAGDNAFPVVT
jgi:hypothetical protein